MYATLPLARLVTVLIWTFILVVAIVWIVQGRPIQPFDVFRALSIGVTLTGLLLLGFFGPTGRLSLWRALWRTFPILNDVLFPDLNGTWEGAQESNWSKIDAMKKASCSKQLLAVEQLDQIELTKLPISLEIKASLFDLQIYAVLPTTDSTSVSAASRVVRTPDGRYILYYVYTQETGLVSSTDESVHDGAARLVFYPERAELKGTYWTKRMWQAALNTAGRVQVVRVDTNRRTVR